MRRLQFNGKVSIGDILTSLSILISLIALLVAWGQDKNLREKEQANKIRTAAADTSAKLERWEEVSLSFFDEIQPAFVQASKIFGNAYDVTATRDYLWETLDAVRLQNFEKLINEDLETAYVNLYGYHPKMRPLFRKTMEDLRSYEEAMFTGLHTDTENIILLDFGDNVAAYRAGQKKYDTAQMGNALRTVADYYQKLYQQQIDLELQCLQDFLTSLVLKNDAELLHGKFENACFTP